MNWGNIFATISSIWVDFRFKSLRLLLILNVHFEISLFCLYFFKMLILVFQKLTKCSSGTSFYDIWLKSTLFEKLFFLFGFNFFYFLLLFHLLLNYFISNKFLLCLKLFDSLSFSVFTLLKKKFDIFECLIIKFGNFSPWRDERLKVRYLYEWNSFAYEFFVKIVLMSHFEFKLN